MRSTVSGFICMLLAVCMFFAGIHIDLEHWIKYEADSCDTFGEAYITSPDEYTEVEIAIRQSEQPETFETRVLPRKFSRKLFFAESDALLPDKVFFLAQCFVEVSDYDKEENEILSPVSVVMNYVHRQDGRKRI